MKKKIQMIAALALLIMAAAHSKAARAKPF
jgi:hypothetical protein